MDKNKVKEEYFKSLDVWRYRGEKIVRYRLLEALSASKYCVIGSDVFKRPIKFENAKLFDQYFYDAISDLENVADCKFVHSIEEAITAFENEFI